MKSFGLTFTELGSSAKERLLSKMDVRRITLLPLKFMKTLLCLFSSFIILHSSFSAQSDSAKAPTGRPNIILIMADDFGYECVTANGGESYQTPHLDRLAAGGMRFEHCHSQPLCTPTRVQLMTGKYNHRLGTQANVVYWDTPWSVPLEHTFLPQRLKAIPGFGATAMYGKCAWGGCAPTPPHPSQRPPAPHPPPHFFPAARARRAPGHARPALLARAPRL